MTAVRLMTWNVRGAARPDLDALAQAIRSFEPDIVAIQEIRAGQARGLARRLGHHHRWALKHFPYGLFLWWRAEGLAVLSAHHVEARHRYILSPGIHAWTHRRRIALRVKVHLPGRTVRIFNAHLASHESAQDRIDQAILLSGFIAEERLRAEAEGEPFQALVLGDLNSHEEPEVLAPLAVARFRDAWTAADTRSDESGHTSTAEAPTARIDYILIEPEDHCLEARVPESDHRWHRLSDHLPVIVHVRLG